ncbi:MAG: hypothetical protein ALECFALPRED_009432 [Alectoria fallacina]|uniref:Uncharacterized protein n=1 Tax=Alectoria fallacina TaxID=1903189 RepID=A0A8H3PJP3_9LECA|nr:MAG: hypothetical protein ALECFALPRED_009432 [Alectoria fallacina]
MFLLPKSLLFTSLTASILNLDATPINNNSNLSALLLPLLTNTTTDTRRNSTPPDGDTWYPYYASSAPTIADTIPLNNISSLTAPNIVCNGQRYGRNLRVASCLEAYNLMDGATVPKTYGQRGTEGPGHTFWDAILPIRIYSSDALCALDISHSASSPFDTITPSLLKSHARSLIAVCVQGTPSLGGVASGLGDHGNLALRVTPYRPRVHCFGPGTGPSWSSCRDLMDAMPVASKQVRFGPSDDVLADVVVPWTIDTVSTPDVCDFYKLWAAASAVEVMCISKGKAGMAVGNVGLKDLDLEAETETGVEMESGVRNASVEVE